MAHFGEMRWAAVASFAIVPALVGCEGTVLSHAPDGGDASMASGDAGTKPMDDGPATEPVFDSGLVDSSVDSNQVDEVDGGDVDAAPGDASIATEAASGDRTDDGAIESGDTPLLTVVPNTFEVVARCQAGGGAVPTSGGVTVTNVSSVTVTVSVVVPDSCVGESPCADAWFIAALSATDPLSATLGPGESVDVVGTPPNLPLGQYPPGPTTYLSPILIETNPPSPIISVPVLEIFEGFFVDAPVVLDFGSVPVGQSSSQTLPGVPDIAPFSLFSPFVLQRTGGLGGLDDTITFTPPDAGLFTDHTGYFSGAEEQPCTPTEITVTGIGTEPVPDASAF